MSETEAWERAYRAAWEAIQEVMTRRAEAMATEAAEAANPALREMTWARASWEAWQRVRVAIDAMHEAIRAAEEAAARARAVGRPDPPPGVAS